MISVIVPVYNVEKYVEKCIESILSQSYKDFEIIIINDGSTDNSLIICENLQSIDNRISIINKKNGGLSDARNVGIKAAKYPYITFIDSDDWIEDSFLETLYNSIIRFNADIAICEFTLDFLQNNKLVKRKIRKKNSNKIKVYSKEEALYELFKDKGIKNYAWGKLYKTKLFNKIEYPVGVYFEDVFTTFKLFEKSNKIIKLNKNLIHYVQHDSNITSSLTNSHKKEKDFFNGFQEQLKYIQSNNNYDKNYYESISFILRQFFRLKKRLVLNELKTQELDLLENNLDEEINNILDKYTRNQIGNTLYLKCRLIIDYRNSYQNYLKKRKG